MNKKRKRRRRRNGLRKRKRRLRQRQRKLQQLLLPKQRLLKIGTWSMRCLLYCVRILKYYIVCGAAPPASAPLLNSHLPRPIADVASPQKRSLIPYNFADSSIGSKASSIVSASSSISPLPSSDLALDTSMARAADFKKELVHSPSSRRDPAIDVLSAHRAHAASNAERPYGQT